MFVSIRSPETLDLAAALTVVENKVFLGTLQELGAATYLESSGIFEIILSR